MQARPVVSRMVRTMDDLAMIIHACYMGYSFPVTGVVDLWNVNVHVLHKILRSPLGEVRRRVDSAKFPPGPGVVPLECSLKAGRAKRLHPAESSSLGHYVLVR